MRRITFAWEFGANYGHLARGLPIAQRLKTRGFDILFAVRDVEVADSMLSPSEMPFVAAPRLMRPVALRRSPINYGQILAEAGYAHRPALRAQLAAWINLWRLAQPSAVVIDHSPTALLAARILNIPCMLLGTGFTIPPDADPMPPLRPWERVSVQELRESDAFVLANINDAVTSFGHPPLQRIADMFAGLPARLATFPELDHYETRPNGVFIGPVGAESNHPSVQWIGGEGPRLFAYLRMGMTGLDGLLGALKELGAEVLCVMPGAPASVVSRLNGPRFQVFPHAVSLSGVLKGASVVVSYGGAGLIAEALIAGVPLLLVPQFVEQHMSAKRVEGLGVGIVLDRGLSQGDFARALTQMMTEPRYKTVAMLLAKKFSPFSSRATCDNTADALAAIVANPE